MQTMLQCVSHLPSASIRHVTYVDVCDSGAGEGRKWRKAGLHGH